MRVEWLPAAERSLENQLAYVAERNPSAAVALGDAIGAAALRLAGFPRSGRPGRVEGTRELAVPGTPYLIVYRVKS